jgi:hypothetical protein
VKLFKTFSKPLRVVISSTMGRGTGKGGENPKDEVPNDAAAIGTIQTLRPTSLGKIQYVGKITMDELKKHRTPGNAWLLVKGKVKYPTLQPTDVLMI